MGGLGGGFDKLKKLTKGSDEDCKVIWEEHQQPHCSTEYEKVCQVPRRLIEKFTFLKWGGLPRIECFQFDLNLDLS